MKNEDLDIESSTTASTESSSSFKVINETPIVISDSDISEIPESENEDLCDNKAENLPMLKSKNNLSENKRDEIQNWIENIESQNICQDTVTYSELSTIYGDITNDNFQPKEKGNAVNSTFADGSCKKFNELFKTKKLSNLFKENISNSSVQEKSIKDLFDNNDEKSIRLSESHRLTEKSLESKHSNNSSFKELIIDESLNIFTNSLENKVTIRKPRKYSIGKNNSLTELEKDSFTIQKSNKSLKYEGTYYKLIVGQYFKHKNC